MYVFVYLFLFTYNDSITYILLDVLNLLTFLRLTESVHVQNTHLFNDGRLAGLAGTK